MGHDGDGGQPVRMGPDGRPRRQLAHPRPRAAASVSATGGTPPAGAARGPGRCTRG
jgi:hypothetical protein